MAMMERWIVIDASSRILGHASYEGRKDTVKK